uniref:Uncharacterized protein n=1 Tax=Anopheles minimus TaxID=112268 RepID=A0A182W059_9DIPT
MLLQLDGAIEATSTLERLQRSSGSRQHYQQTKDTAVADERNEAINRTLLTGTGQNVTSLTGVRLHTHVTVAMAQGNSSTATLVPKIPTATPTLTSSTPTEQPARKADILIYPTVSPETIVVPILSCIVGFPIFALLVICCLRRRAKIARERDRRRNFDLKANTITLVRFNSHH